MKLLHEKLQRYYEEMGDLRERSLERLGEYFSEDVRFRDPFRDTYGLPALHELFVRWFKRYPTVSFTNFRGAGDDVHFTLRYEMNMRMRFGPWLVAPTASICTAEGGKVVELEDYYDMEGVFVSPFRRVRAARIGMVKAFFL